MSLNNANDRINEALRALDQAKVELDLVRDYFHKTPTYVPKVGDLIRVEYRWHADLGDPQPWAAIVKYVTDDHEGYGPVIDCYLDLDIAKHLRFSISSLTGKGMRFLRRATPAEMAQFGIVEKDVPSVDVQSIRWY